MGRTLTAFDRLAWVCSWLAPAGWGLTVAGIVAEILLQRLDGGGRVNSVLPLVVFPAASIGLLAQLVLTYHVQKRPLFSENERRTLWRALYFGGGYRLWRMAMRAHASQ